MNTNLALTLLSVLLLISLMACQPSGLSSSTPTVPSVVTIIALDLTPTLAVTPTPKEAGETPSPHATQTATVSPSATPDLQATLVATVTPTTFASYLSPDGGWQAEVVIYDCTAIQEDGMEYSYEEIRLANNSSQETTIIESQFGFCGGLGAYGLDGVNWSLDSHYFYYTPHREGGPDGCGYFVPNVLRYDVTTGETVSLGLATSAPDLNTYASWTWDRDQADQKLRVWSINSSEIRELEPYQPTVHAGPIAWSPDGKEFIYLQKTYGCTEDGTAWLVRVDAEALEQELLLETETLHLWTVEWSETDSLILTTIGFENDKTYSYNLATGMIEEIP